MAYEDYLDTANFYRDQERAARYYSTQAAYSNAEDLSRRVDEQDAKNHPEDYV